MANPNIVNVSQIYGKTVGSYTAGSGITALLNSTGSGKIYKVNNLSITNTNTTAVTVTAYLYSGGSLVNQLASLISIPGNSVLVIISKDTSIYLEEGQEIRLNTAFGTHYTCSYEEIS